MAVPGIASDQRTGLQNVDGRDEPGQHHNKTE